MDHIMMYDTLRAILGIVGGVTEFLPVSSTGLAAGTTLLRPRRGGFWQSFVVLIQLGAILAIVALYFAKLWKVALRMFFNPDDRRFVIGVLVAFLPQSSLDWCREIHQGSSLQSVGGLLLADGGAILMWVDQLDLKPHEHDATSSRC